VKISSQKHETTRQLLKTSSMTKDLNKSEEEEISNIKVQNIIVRMINE
jgi:hypothetical protein